jgi:hypothetical protein
MVKYLPHIDQKTIEILFENESIAWKTQPITVDEMRHELAYVKATISSLPAAIDTIDPASLLFR